MTDWPSTMQYRPIDSWPGARTRERRRSPFSAAFPRTLQLLDRELRMLQARRPVVLQIAVPEGAIRLDGMPYANARPEHPGVILSMETKHGPLRYACDAFWTWQENLRAIALGLEALRQVERYGITKRGEQYTGFLKLGPASTGDKRDAAALLDQYGGEKEALRRAHPDLGGSHAEFARVQEARRLLGLTR